ncbi:MAG: Asp-tRNA(Asn)/Glu-tRNA(Gln) amidotransferase subunit GatA [Patescibacteria group bacterium]|nr:Asp-tRNA(Asn)/Glu-tRNA(Gln) amidotransferase subunit GatA [Patescibacteria group bacterium]
MKLNELTITEAKKGLADKKFSTNELRDDCLAQIKKVDSKIKAFVTVGEQGEEGREGTELSGIPVAIKDVLSTKNLRTTASSKILENYFPVYDGTVVERIKKGGAVIIGKTNCDAFAFGGSTEHSGYGLSYNPWDLSRVPGGSSGGSAAAVAADECLFALGTDTGGSIRQPASFCNITGLKPTYGACPRYGLLAMASSFDCPGPMAKTVEDCEIVFNWMEGEDFHDATSSAGQIKKHIEKQDKIKIGLPKEYFAEGIDEEVKTLVMAAAKLLEQNGFLLEEVTLPRTEYGVPVYYTLIFSEISSNMARYDGIRFGKDRDSFEDEVKRRIMLGTYTLSAGYFDQYYLKASRVRSLVQKDFEEVFKKVDCLLGPVAPTPAFKIGEKSNDPVQLYLEDILTVSANLAGIPSLALPCGFTKENLPVGMQIMGPAFSEEGLFKIGKRYQELTDWHKRKPEIK